MTALCLIIVLLTAPFSMGYSAYSNLTLNVGDNATFYCLVPVNDSVSWSINNTLYSSNWLPDDYYVIYGEEYYTLYIDEVKLFMSGTIFSCYYIDDDLFSPIGQLYVNFDLDGPDNDTMKFQPYEQAFINCNSSLNENPGVYIIWRINGTVFHPSMMPPYFYPKYSGLYINSTQYSMNGTTIQCLLWSPMLYKNQYYYSEIGTLLITEKTTKFKCEHKLLCDRNLPRIEFYYQKFDRNGAHYTIAWTAADCNLPFDYYVVRVSGDTIYNTSVGTNTSKVFHLMELYDNSEPYAIYVKAVQNDSLLCAITGYYLQISSRNIHKKYIKAGSNYCPPYNGINHVVWPYEIQSRGQECRCDNYAEQLPDCSCVNDTGYKVSLKNNRICWSNINKNGTKIAFLVNNVKLLSYDGQKTPGDIIEEMYDILFADPPVPPTVRAFYNRIYTNTLCVEDNFNGNAVIEKYHVTIINYANGIYNFDYNTTNEDQSDGEACIPYSENTIANPYCRPLNITVMSENMVGISQPSDAFYYMENADSQKCLCLNHSVKIDVNSSSDTSKITFHIACENYYVNIENFQFLIKLDDNEQNLECSEHQEKTFGALQENTMYNAVITVRDITTNEVCVFKELGNYATKNKLAIYIGAPFGSVFGIIVVTVAVIAGILLYKQLKKKNEVNVN